jgi:hypothetical protein
MPLAWELTFRAWTAGPVWISEWSSPTLCERARVAEWQTRWLQVPVSERAWGFKSPLAHHKVLSQDGETLEPFGFEGFWFSATRLTRRRSTR